MAYHLERYVAYADKWRYHCIGLVNQEPPPLTDRDKKLLERARDQGQTERERKPPKEAKVAVSDEERKAKLGEEIVKWQRRGWVVQDRTDFTAQLMKPAEKRGCVSRVLFGLLLLFFPRKDEYLLLEVTEKGKIRRKRWKK